MKIDNLLHFSSAMLISLAHRLDIQAKAQHSDKDLQAETEEMSNDCRISAEALAVVAQAYAPIIQSAVDTGIAGHTHRIAVQILNPEYDAGYDDPIAWTDVSIHTFEVSKEVMQ